MSTTIRAATAADYLAVDRQPSQYMQLGVVRTGVDEAEARAVIEGGESWAIERDGRVVGVMGLYESFPGAQADAWALLSADVGAAHIAMTRHARRRIADSPLVRIQALVNAKSDAECLWARLVGMEPAAVLRRFGAASEDHILFERVRADG